MNTSLTLLAGRKAGVETRVVAAEPGLDAARAGALVRLAGHIRKLPGMDVEEGVSTCLLIYAASLIAGGMKVDRAIEAAIVEPLSDEPDVQEALRDLAAISCCPKTPNVPPPGCACRWAGQPPGPLPATSNA